MKKMVVGMLQISAIALLFVTGSTLAAVYEVDWKRVGSDPDRFSYFSNKTVTKGDFSDSLSFSLSESGSLSLGLRVNDNYDGFFKEWVNVQAVSLVDGNNKIFAETDKTDWVKSDPYYSGSPARATWEWDYLASGNYKLLIEGEADSSWSGSSSYMVDDLVFTAGAGTPPSPVPVPPAVLLFGSGLIGLLGFRKR